MFDGIFGVNGGGQNGGEEPVAEPVAEAKAEPATDATEGEPVDGGNVGGLNAGLDGQMSHGINSDVNLGDLEVGDLEVGGGFVRLEKLSGKDIASLSPGIMYAVFVPDNHGSCVENEFGRICAKQDALGGSLFLRIDFPSRKK